MSQCRVRVSIYVLVIHSLWVTRQSNIATRKELKKMSKGIHYTVPLVMRILFKLKGNYITSHILITIIRNLRIINNLIVLQRRDCRQGWREKKKACRNYIRCPKLLSRGE